MDLVLYDPEHGYYADPSSRKVGRGGDFYTSVSVGETFGFLLAERISERKAAHFGEETPLVVVEQGAHDGQLAVDIVSALRDKGVSVDYRIVDPRESVRASLNELVEKAGLSEITVVESLEAAAAQEGIFLCNELLDAFPVHRLILREEGWQERRVAWSDAGLEWVDGPLDEALARWAPQISDDYEEGYETEVCPAADQWLAEAAKLFARGMWWIIDYGHESEDYFAPHRRSGTLRCYHGHRAAEDPFQHPGETDITAHVNFTHLRESATRAGLSWDGLTDQHYFLTHAARDWLLSIEGEPPGPENAKRLRQFQTLTHPGIMGQSFKLAELSLGIR